MSKELVKVLEDALEVIQTKGWTQGAMAKRPLHVGMVEGIIPTDAMDSGAACFCLSGALRRATRLSTKAPDITKEEEWFVHHERRRLFTKACHAIADVPHKLNDPEWYLVNYNDRRGRTQEEVEDKIKIAIANLMDEDADNERN